MCCIKLYDRIGGVLAYECDKSCVGFRSGQTKDNKTGISPLIGTQHKRVRAENGWNQDNL